MKIDEAISECEYGISFADDEHQQIAERLEDYKKLKHETEQDIYERAYKEGQDKGLSDGRFLGYNTAINEFLGKCKNGVQNGELYDFVKWNNWNNCACEWFEKIAEQLKEGGTDE